MRRVGFNTDQSHSWLVRLLIQMLWLSAIVLLIALYYILSNKIKCATFGLSCECSKIWEWSECSRKAGHKKWIKKRASDTLETWRPGAVVIGLFCTYLIPIQAVTVDEGQTEGWRVRCVWLRQIWYISSIRFCLSAVKSPWVNSQLLASPLLVLFHLQMAYWTWVWMHLLGLIHTIMRQSSFFIT